MRAPGDDATTPGPGPKGKAKPREAPKANGDARAKDQGDLPIILTGGPLDHARQLVGLEFTHPEGRGLHRHRGGFHVWGGASYREITIEEVREIVYRFYECCCRKVETDQGVELVKIKPHRRMVGDFIDALMAEAFLRDDVAVPSWLKGTGPADLIPLRNGLLDLGTGRLHPHTPRYFGNYSLPFDYDPNPPGPVEWSAFLKGLWPEDQEAIDTLQEMMGLLLTTDTSHQKIFLLVGPKRSGKGTIARIIRQLLGPENVAGPTLGGMTMNFGLQCLIGKPAAIIADARLSSRSDAAVIAERLLSISGEDVQTVDRKHRDPWTGMLPTRFLILTNELPKISDTSGALASRFIILTLTQSFYGKEDHGLLDRLLPELPGIFGWALAGRRRLAERGRFKMPKSSEAAVERLELLSSPITAFLRDECVVKPGGTIPCKVLYDHWRAWCEQQGRDRPGTQQAFGNDLHSAVPGLGMAQVRDGAGGRWRVYNGIRLRCSTDEAAPGS